MDLGTNSWRTLGGQHLKVSSVHYGSLMKLVVLNVQPHLYVFSSLLRLWQMYQVAQVVTDKTKISFSKRLV